MSLQARRFPTGNGHGDPTDIRKHVHVLTPGHYVGSAAIEDEPPFLP